MVFLSSPVQLRANTFSTFVLPCLEDNATRSFKYFLRQIKKARETMADEVQGSRILKPPQVVERFMNEFESSFNSKNFKIVPKGASEEEFWLAYHFVLEDKLEKHFRGRRYLFKKDVEDILSEVFHYDAVSDALKLVNSEHYSDLAVIDFYINLRHVTVEANQPSVVRELIFKDVEKFPLQIFEEVGMFVDWQSGEIVLENGDLRSFLIPKVNDYYVESSFASRYIPGKKGSYGENALFIEEILNDILLHSAFDFEYFLSEFKRIYRRNPKMKELWAYQQVVKKVTFNKIAEVIESKRGGLSKDLEHFLENYKYSVEPRAENMDQSYNDLIRDNILNKEYTDEMKGHLNKWIGQWTGFLGEAIVISRLKNVVDSGVKIRTSEEFASVFKHDDRFFNAEIDVIQKNSEGKLSWGEIKTKSLRKFEDLGHGNINQLFKLLDMIAYLKNIKSPLAPSELRYYFSGRIEPEAVTELRELVENYLTEKNYPEISFKVYNRN